MCFSFILCVRREMGFNKKKEMQKKIKKGSHHHYNATAKCAIATTISDSIKKG
jgi:hypothetical protein